MSDTERPYRVHLRQYVTTVIDTTAADPAAAIEYALENAPSPVNSTNHGIDPAGEWEEAAVYDADEREVWNADALAPELGWVLDQSSVGGRSGLADDTRRMYATDLDQLARTLADAGHFQAGALVQRRARAVRAGA